MTDPGEMTQAELIAAVRRVESDRAESLNISGRLLAALHDVHGLSWPQVERATGIPRSTAHRRAEPFLRSSEDET